MQVKSMVFRVAVFAVALTAGVVAAMMFSSSKLPVIDPVPYQKPILIEDGTASSSHGTAGTGTGVGTGTSVNGNAPLKILSKPRPGYTDDARSNNVQGDVTLRVTFLASGEIGGINVVSGLPDGLNEQSIKAARNIKFAPQVVGGNPVTVQKTLKYSFSIY